MKTLTFILACTIVGIPAFSQMKYIVDDFEGLAAAEKKLSNEGFFHFGSVEYAVDKASTTGEGFSGSRAIKVTWNGKEQYGGWGKGIGMNVQLDPKVDYFNFYVLSPKVNQRKDNILISIQEDDNGSEKFEEHGDDQWETNYIIEPKGEWQLVSIPLHTFTDGNKGGDGVFNASYDGGKLFTVIFKFKDSTALSKGQSWFFDMISFSQGPLVTSEKSVFTPVAAVGDQKCALGAWSEEGMEGDLTKIPEAIEGLFKDAKDRQLGVVHFFQPFSMGSNSGKNLYPPVNEIKQLITKGYLPMFTLENHFANIEDRQHRQPNLYSILEGHQDAFFIEWAKHVKQINGEILLRILHEFNGDWYPWSVVNNNEDPGLYVKTYRHIWELLKKEGVENVKFIWCPNSMSIPQKSWNYIMKAYPGDEYVDYVGLDVYNGAGERGADIWRSFRKEAIENYFILTQQLPDKPLLICETASRERLSTERGELQTKAEWLKEMSFALQTDLSKIQLLTWFDEYDTFKINSSEAGRESFRDFIWNSPYFEADPKKLLTPGTVVNKR